MAKNTSEKNFVQVSSIMTKDVVKFERTDSLKKIVQLMQRKKISCVIIAKDSIPEGIITERDLLFKVLGQDKKIENMKAEDVMTSPVLTVPSDISHVMAGEIMKKNGVRRFPVVDSKNRMVGIITESDIISGMITTIKKLNYELVSKAITMEKYLGDLRKE